MATSICIECKREVAELEVFPGPRCLACHARKVEHEPLERPDFVGAINGIRRARQPKAR